MNRKKIKNSDFFSFRLGRIITWPIIILFFIAYFFLSLFILWALFDVLDITVSGRGLVVTENGFSSLQSQVSGSVSEIKVKSGDIVQTGDVLLKTKNQESVLTSPFKGRVLEVIVNIGDLVQKSTPLVWMEVLSPENSKPLIYGYFPLDSGKKLRIGTPVKMTLPYINKNFYGALKGSVSSISSYAETEESLLKEIQNEALVDYLMDHASAVVKVVIEPLEDKGNFVWTSHSIPSKTVTTGSVGPLEAIVERISPIYYLIPLKDFRNSRVDNDN